MEQSLKSRLFAEYSRIVEITAANLLTKIKSDGAMEDLTYELSFDELDTDNENHMYLYSVAKLAIDSGMIKLPVTFKLPYSYNIFEVIRFNCKYNKKGKWIHRSKRMHPTVFVEEFLDFTRLAFTDAIWDDDFSSIYEIFYKR